MAYADKDADKRTASNTKLEAKARMAACERLLAIKGLSEADRAWTLIRRGVVYRHMKKYDAALADLAQAEKLDPGNSRLTGIEPGFTSTQKNTPKPTRNSPRPLSLTRAMSGVGTCGRGPAHR